MTPIDLRIKFKMETGEYPVWCEQNEWRPWDGWIIKAKEVIRGIPKSIYGLWLEEQLGIKEIRDIYHCDTSHYATYPTKRNERDRLCSQYTLWLEHQLCG